MLHAVEAHPLEVGVRRRPRRSEGVAAPHHGEHPAAGGAHRAAGVAPGPGVEEQRTRIEAIEPGDGVAAAHRAGVARRCRDHADRGAGQRPRHPRREAAAGARGEQVEQVLVEQREHRLGLGVAEARVELEQPRPRVGEHQPRVEAASVRRAALAERRDARLDEAAQGVVEERRGVETRGRRVGAHPPGVGAAVAVVDALVVARGGEDPHRRAVAEREDAHLAAAHPLLDDHPGARVAEAALEEAGVDGGARLGGVVAHRHPLAEGEAVRLDDAGAELGGEPVERLAILDAPRTPARGGDAGRVRELLGELLRRLHPPRGAGGAEHRDAALGAAVGEPGGDRRVGADDDEVDGALGREPEDPGDVVRGDCDVLGDRRGAAVAGSADELDARMPCASPRERVLPRPGAGDEDPRHSHSMVDGGLLLMSYTTRFTPWTSLTMRREIAPRTSYGTFAQSAVIPSSLVTMRIATTFA